MRTRRYNVTKFKLKEFRRFCIEQSLDREVSPSRRLGVDFGITACYQADAVVLVGNGHALDTPTIALD